MKINKANKTTIGYERLEAKSWHTSHKAFHVMKGDGP